MDIVLCVLIIILILFYVGGIIQCFRYSIKIFKIGRTFIRGGPLAFIGSLVLGIVPIVNVIHACSLMFGLLEIKIDAKEHKKIKEK